MNNLELLDSQIKKAAFWSAVLGLGCGVLSAFFPLDIPDGYLAENHLRVEWLVANTGDFISGWLVQILAMLTLSGVFAGIAWQAREKSPLGALLSVIATAMATMAFVIPKFMAVWTLPMLAKASLGTGEASVIASQLLPLLNVSIPFSLFTSMDYLGFWLYALAAAPLVRPLLPLSVSAKIAAISLGAYFVLYHAMFLGVMGGKIQPEQIGDYAGVAFAPLLVMMIAMVVFFRKA